MNSCLYECAVMHHRLQPREHQFRYRIFMFYLDLAELDTLAGKLRWFGYNRRNLYAFRDADHLQQGKPTARENVLAWIAAQGLELPANTRVCLLTLPRIAGYLFNPVSFYFCFDTAGAPVAAVAEVGNTFGEMKPYLLRGEELTNGEVFRRIVPKHFYVSPFSSLDLSFDFKLRVPGDSLEIHIDDRAGEQRVLLSALTGKRVALTDATLAHFTVKYPLLTLKVIFLIHWQALLLWWKKVPWHRKAANAAQQRDVLNPHPSIAGKLS